MSCLCMHVASVNAISSVPELLTDHDRRTT
jgi:hypothetical protein